MAKLTMPLHHSDFTQLVIKNIIHTCMLRLILVSNAKLSYDFPLDSLHKQTKQITQSVKILSNLAVDIKNRKIQKKG